MFQQLRLLLSPSLFFRNILHVAFGFVSPFIRNFSSSVLFFQTSTSGLKFSEYVFSDVDEFVDMLSDVRFSALQIWFILFAFFFIVFFYLFILFIFVFYTSAQVELKLVCSLVFGFVFFRWTMFFYIHSSVKQYLQTFFKHGEDHCSQ